MKPLCKGLTTLRLPGRYWLKRPESLCARTIYRVAIGTMRLPGRWPTKTATLTGTVTHAADTDN
jgi:hypothetical protein